MKILIVLLCISFSSFARFIPKSFVANLEQVSKSRISKKEIREDVEIKYLFPKNIQMSLKNMIYTCNDKKTWNYQPPFLEGEKGELTIGNSSKYCFSKIFDAISSGFRANKVYSIKKEGKKATFNFVTKAQKSLNLSKIEFLFKKNISKEPSFLEVESMIIHHLDKKKKTTKLEIKKISTDIKLSRTDFIFKVPKNTNVQYLK